MPLPTAPFRRMGQFREVTPERYSAARFDGSGCIHSMLAQMNSAPRSVRRRNTKLSPSDPTSAPR